MRKREREVDVITDRRARLRSRRNGHSFFSSVCPSIRLAVSYPGERTSLGRHNFSSFTPSHCALTAASRGRSLSLVRNIVCFFSRSLVLPTVRLRRRLSSLNAIDVYSLFGKARWRHLAPCHVYRSTLIFSTFFPVRDPTVVRRLI